MINYKIQIQYLLYLDSMSIILKYILLIPTKVLWVKFNNRYLGIKCTTFNNSKVFYVVALGTI